MQYLRVHGNDYEMGLQIGEHFSSYLKQAILPYEEELSNQELLREVRHLKAMLKEEYPNGLREIYGRADGAGIDRDATLLMFFPEIQKRVDGCTTLFLRKPNGHLLFSHNEDDKNFTEENTALIRYEYEDFWVIGYTMAEKLLGSSYAFNSAGLIFSTNYIYPVETHLEYLSRYVLSRRLMNAKSISEVFEILNEMKVASPFSLNVLSRKTLEAWNIEKDNERLYAHKITDRLGRANHFLMRPFDELSAHPSTAFRTEYVQTELAKLDAQTAKLEDLKKILSYHEEDYNRCVYKQPGLFTVLSVTVSNFSYDSETDTIEIYDYLNNTSIKKGYSEFE